jgi:putative transposase
MKRKVFLRLRERYARRGCSFIHLDECGFALEAARLYGYSLKGKRVYGEISGHKRPRTSLLAARMPDGTLQATQLWEGTCNADIFNDWLEHQLAPYMTSAHVVVMDNAAFHKSSKTREIIEKAGAKLLYLPPYSPDLNPIEHDFVALKKIRQFNHSKSIDDIITTYQ